MTQTSTQPKGKAILFGLLRLAVAAALLAWLVASGAIDWSILSAVLRPWWLFPLLALLAVAGGLTEAWRLCIVFRSQEIHIPFLRAARLVLVAMFFGIAVPGGTGGDVMKLYYLSTGHRGRAVEVATVLLAERGIALLTLLFLVCVFGGLNLPLLHAQPVLAGLVGLAAAALLGLTLLAATLGSRTALRSRWLAAVVGRLPLGHLLGRAAEALALLRGHRVAVAGTALISILGQLLVALVFLLIAARVMPEAAARVVPLLGFLGMFANALPIAPAGLGVGEAAFEQLFTAAGISGGAALMILVRLSLLPLYLGGSILYVLGRREKRE